MESNLLTVDLSDTLFLETHSASIEVQGPGINVLGQFLNKSIIEMFGHFCFNLNSCQTVF